MVHEITQYITWTIWPRRPSTQIAKAVKSLDTRLCAPAYMRLRRKRNAKIPTNEENYPCFAPQLAPTPKERKSNGCLTTCFWELRRDARKRNLKGTPAIICQCPDETLWQPRRDSVSALARICECPDEFLKGAQRNFVNAPTKFQTKF